MPRFTCNIFPKILVFSMRTTINVFIKNKKICTVSFVEIKLSYVKSVRSGCMSEAP